jgi:hypothetical protein
VRAGGVADALVGRVRRRRAAVGLLALEAAAARRRRALLGRLLAAAAGGAVPAGAAGGLLVLEVQRRGLVGRGAATTLVVGAGAGGGLLLLLGPLLGRLLLARVGGERAALAGRLGRERALGDVARRFAGGGDVLARRYLATVVSRGGIVIQTKWRGCAYLGACARGLVGHGYG